MQYSASSGVLVEVRESTPGFMSEFFEFMRQNMISPMVRSVATENGHGVFYRGIFSKQSAPQVQEWLESKGVPKAPASQE